MQPFAALTSRRLLLRRFQLADAPEVQRFAGDRDLAATTLNIPHPYEDGMGETWIRSQEGHFEKGERLDLAITRPSDSILLGAIGLGIDQANERAELGYWIRKPALV